jgi:hypothetical protein
MIRSLWKNGAIAGHLQVLDNLVALLPQTGHSGYQQMLQEKSEKGVKEKALAAIRPRVVEFCRNGRVNMNRELSLKVCAVSMLIMKHKRILRTGGDTSMTGPAIYLHVI